MNRLFYALVLLPIFLPNAFGGEEEAGRADQESLAQFEQAGFSEVRQQYNAPLDVPLLVAHVEKAQQAKKPVPVIIREIEQLLADTAGVDQLLFLSRLHLQARMYGEAIGDLRRLQNMKMESGFQLLEFAFLSYSLGNYADAIVNARLSSESTTSRWRQDLLIVLSLSQLDFELEGQADVVAESLEMLAKAAPRAMENEYVKRVVKPAYLAKYQQFAAEDKNTQTVK